MSLRDTSAPPALSIRTGANLFHWSPLRRYGRIDYNSIRQSINHSYSMKVVKRLFPDFAAASSIDIYSKQASLADEDGKRKKVSDIYGQDPALPAHIKFAREFILALKPRKNTKKPCLILWGAYAAEFFNQHIQAIDKSIKHHLVQINGAEFNVFLLPHPEHMGRYMTRVDVEALLPLSKKIEACGIRFSEYGLMHLKDAHSFAMSDEDVGDEPLSHEDLDFLDLKTQSADGGRYLRNCLAATEKDMLTTLKTKSSKRIMWETVKAIAEGDLRIRLSEGKFCSPDLALAKLIPSRPY